MNGHTQVLYTLRVITRPHCVLERIANQKFAVHALVTLYRHSANVPGTIHVDNTKGSHPGDKRLFRNIRHGIRSATTTTATVFGNVASQIAGGWVVFF